MPPDSKVQTFRSLKTNAVAMTLITEKQTLTGAVGGNNVDKLTVTEIVTAKQTNRRNRTHRSRHSQLLLKAWNCYRVGYKKLYNTVEEFVFQHKARLHSSRVDIVQIDLRI